MECATLPAPRRRATSSGTLTWPDVVTNGDTWADSGSGSSGEFAYTAQTGLHYVQLDLGAVYSVDKVRVWHYAADGRIYNATKTQVSADGTTWYTVFDSAVSGTYAETAAGRTYTFAARNVRYVRDYLNGSNKNAGNHWVEIEVWGTRTTVYVGAHYEKNVTANTTTSYYYLGSQRVAQRAGGVVYYLHADHLGSASLTTDAGGNKVGELRYLPYGETRTIWGITRTNRRFTGQIEDAAIGLYFYNARYYDPALGRFIQADSIVPGAASGSGGGAATLGYDSKTRLTPLTVNLGEFAAQVNAENREVLQFGAFFQWDSKTRQEHNVPMGPANPQALNRYAYCLNNPLRYVDPTGHFQVELSAEEAGELMNTLEQLSDFSLGSAIASEAIATILKLFGERAISDESVALLLGGLPVSVVSVALFLDGVCMALTYDDLNNIRIALGDLGADETGAKISLNPGIFGSKLTVTTDEGSRILRLRNLSLVGSQSPYVIGSLMIHYIVRQWLDPGSQYKVYMPIVAR